MFRITILELLPFFILLSAIAVGPLLFRCQWEKNTNKLKLSLILGIPLSFILIFQGYTKELIHAVLFDYLPFIILLSTLFVITGGISIRGDIEANPRNNSAFLGIGAIAASFIGTTGAAMLLIRPLIKTNIERKYKTHTLLFFIAVVANCGGLLTPLGDPPLFILYLRGASFTWFLHLFPEWLLINGFLILIYYFFDYYFYAKESPKSIKEDKAHIEPIKIHGKLNFIWLAGVVIATAIINENTFPVFKRIEFLKISREIVLLTLLVLSLKFTPKHLHLSNNFSYEPIKEVAFLFLGIFITIVPCILYLEKNAANLLLTNPSQFYFACGFLSSFLDNTPTAITFHSLALGLFTQSPEIFSGIRIVSGIPETLLKAISVSSVIFGSMTYIGNGPNFMIKAIAGENQIRMPHFFSYIFRFSIPILLPVFIIAWLLLM